MAFKNLTYLLIAVSVCCGTQFVSGQEATDQYAYKVDLGDIKNDQLRVELTPPKIVGDETTFFIPKIAPGIYGAENYGQFISDVEAFDGDGKSLNVTKRDQNSWSIKDASQIKRLTYTVDDSWEEFEVKPSLVRYRSAGASFDADERFIINHNCLFGYFEGMSNLPYEVSISHPEKLVGATSLLRTSHEPNRDVFRADNFRSLVDNPVVYGVADTIDFKVKNTEITIAIYSEDGQKHASHFGKVMKPLMEAQARYLGGELPVDRYTFIIVWEEGPKNSMLGDGLEHSNSTLVLLEGSSLEEATKFIRDICAHEFFHILMPLTIKSEEIANYDFNEPKQSKHLWLYEGMTEYSTIHMPMVEGLVNRHDFLQSIRRKIVDSQSFRKDVSLTHASKNAMEMQDQYYNFYLKGMLGCLCLDVELHRLTDGEIGTQELLQALSNKYGVDKSFKDDELFDVIAELTSPKIREWLAKYIDGTEALPLKSTLAGVGIKYDERNHELGWMDSLSAEQKRLQSQWLNIGQSSSAVDNTELDQRISSLFETILKEDQRLFDACFSSRGASYLKANLTEDLEFYHDKNGLLFTSSKDFIEGFETVWKLQDEGTNEQVRRELVTESMKVYPLNDYGAIQIADHKFFVIGKEGAETHMDNAKIVHVWKEQDGDWKLARSFSYDHQPATAMKSMKSELDAAAIFDSLKPLVGSWQGKSDAGYDYRLEYSLSARDSVLVEHWHMPSGSDSMTLYHLDGNRLIATHYCPHGNQPQLELTKQCDDGTLEFEFKSATNMKSEEESHQHKFQLRFTGTDTVWRNEVYLSKGAEDSDAGTYQRVIKD